MFNIKRIPLALSMLALVGLTGALLAGPVSAGAGDYTECNGTLGAFPAGEIILVVDGATCIVDSPVTAEFKVLDQGLLINNSKITGEVHIESGGTMDNNDEVIGEVHVDDGGTLNSGEIGELKDDNVEKPKED